MINALKEFLEPSLKAEGFSTVEVSYIHQSDDLSNTGNIPALVITRGKGTGSESSGDSRVMQRIDRNIELHLKCHEAQLEGLTEILMRHILGWQFNPYWSGVNYYEDEAVASNGPYVWIAFRFNTWVTAKEGKYYNGPSGPGQNLPQV